MRQPWSPLVPCGEIIFRYGNVSSERVANPLAVAAPQGQPLCAALEDGLVLVGPWAVADLDEHELRRLAATLGGIDAAGGVLERGAVPAAILRGGRREVAVDLLERGLEGGPG